MKGGRAGILRINKQKNINKNDDPEINEDYLAKLGLKSSDINNFGGKIISKVFKEESYIKPNFVQQQKNQKSQNVVSSIELSSSKKQRPQTAHSTLQNTHQKVQLSDIEENNNEGAYNSERVQGPDYYDHHAEIMEQKRQFEMDELQREFDNIHQVGDTDLEGDLREAREFDDLTKSLRQNKAYEISQTLKDKSKGELAQIGVRESSDEKLMFRKIPYILWTVGIVIFLLGNFLLYTVILSYKVILIKGFGEGIWWQYFVSCLIIALGSVITYVGKVETVIFNRSQGLLTYQKRSICCATQLKEWTLDEVHNIRAYKRGHDSAQANTLHYEVTIDFKTLPSVKLFETKSKTKAIKQTCQIKGFLGMPISRSDLKVTDQSTSRFKRERSYSAKH